MKKRCPESCPECKGKGEVDLLTKVVPCSQPWAAKGGIIPGSGPGKVNNYHAQSAGMTLEQAGKLVADFHRYFPGARDLNEREYKRELEGTFDCSEPNVQQMPRGTPRFKLDLAAQCMSIVERHGGAMTIDDRGPGNLYVDIVLGGERFYNVPGRELTKLFTMHQYGAGLNKLVEMLITNHRGSKFDRPRANSDAALTAQLEETLRRMKERGVTVKPITINVQAEAPITSFFRPRSQNPCAEIPLPVNELLCLGGPKHGEFVQHHGRGIFQCYEDPKEPISLHPALATLEGTMMKVHSYEPKPVIISGRRQTVLVHEGDDLSKHMLFVNKLLNMFRPTNPQSRLSRSAAEFQEHAAALCLEPNIINCEVNYENHVDTEDPRGPRRSRYQTVTIKMVRDIGPDGARSEG